MALGYGRVSTNQFATAKYIVDANGLSAGATHTTISSALTSASSGETIFIKPGTYTENLTLKAGVNLAAFPCDSQTPNVTIVGKCTATFAGTCSIFGIRLQTNGDYFLSVTGSSATIVRLFNCYFNCTNFTGIQSASSSGSSQLYFYYCVGELTTTGIAYFTHSSAGSITIQFCQFENAGLGTTNNTISAGIVYIRSSRLVSAITTSTGGLVQLVHSQLITPPGVNQVMLTHGGGTTNCFVKNCEVSSGTSSAISISVGSVLVVYNTTIESSNANPITGAGTVNYGSVNFSSNSSNVNTTTQTNGILYCRELSVKNMLTSSTGGAGGTNQWQITNSSNTASSAAKLDISVGGGSASDAFTSYTVSGAQTWSEGIDNSDSDAFVVAASTALGTTNVARCSTAGEWNYPLQPAFLASNASDVTNVTGDGATYTCVYGTEIFDQNNDFASNTFTAPVTGRYQLSASIGQGNLSASFIISQIVIATSNRNYCFGRFSSASIRSTFDNTLFINGSFLCDMDAGDTAVVRMTTSGGTRTITYLGSTGATDASPPYFSGILVA